MKALTPLSVPVSAVLGNCFGQKHCGQGFLCWQLLLDYEPLAQADAILGMLLLFHTWCSTGLHCLFSVALHGYCKPCCVQSHNDFINCHFIYYIWAAFNVPWTSLKFVNEHSVCYLPSEITARAVASHWVTFILMFLFFSDLYDRKSEGIPIPEHQLIVSIPCSLHSHKPPLAGMFWFLCLMFL